MKYNFSPSKLRKTKFGTHSHEVFALLGGGERDEGVLARLRAVLERDGLVQQERAAHQVVLQRVAAAAPEGAAEARVLAGLPPQVRHVEAAVAGRRRRRLLLRLRARCELQQRARHQARQPRWPHLKHTHRTLD